MYHNMHRRSLRLYATSQSMRNISTTSSLNGRQPSRLPRLPVPKLRDTLDRYLTSIEPLLLENEKHGGLPYDTTYRIQKSLAEKFETGIGQVLQERLLGLDNLSPNNWLDDNFWAVHAYLKSREPLLVNSNWWLAFLDDPLIPREEVHADAQAGGITKWQIRRAAWIVRRMLHFKDETARTPAKTKNAVWVQECTAKLFNGYRHPASLCDILAEPPSSPTPASRSIYVTVHNFFYLVTVYEPNGTLAHVAEIEARLCAIVKDVQERRKNGEEAPPIGVLSADRREFWARCVENLYYLSDINKASHEAIIDSLLGLSLDSKTNYIASSSSPRQAELDAHLHSIRGTSHNVANRLFDKPLTVIVDPSARAGAMGEHSVVDALIPSIVAEYGIIEGVDQSAFSPHESLDGVSGWERLDWKIDDAMWRRCRLSQQHADKIINDSDDSVLWFEDYGTNWLKDSARLPPDAYLQLALQLAFYTTRKEFTATYETALTRMYNKGRTETIRSLTRESREWVLAMIDPSSTRQERLKKLHIAISRHTRLTREACTGRGIDRHLLALKLLLRRGLQEESQFLDHPLMDQSSEWRLSTSGLSAGNLFAGTGFGTSLEDGYGINYLAAPERIKFGIESKHSSRLTSTVNFKEAISDALREMRELYTSPGQAHDHTFTARL